jgi:hypothetical protein
MYLSLLVWGEFVDVDSPGLEACVENELQRCPHLFAGVEKEVNPTLLHDINQLFNFFFIDAFVEVTALP